MRPVISPFQLQVRHFLVYLLLLLATTAVAQSTKLEFGHIDSLHSKVLNEQRGLWVYVPPADPSGVYAPKRYPVLYVLDGDWHFPYVMGLVQQLSAVNGNTVCPEMIIVGIPNTFRTRTRDLTPTHSTVRWDNREDRSLASSGGGGQFLRFLETEVVPYVEAHYPTAPYRMLVGHSLGGLTVLNALATIPHVFNTYLAIEPSTWWDHGMMLPRLQTAFRQRPALKRKFFLAVANTMPAGMDTARVRRDTASSTYHIRTELALVDLLRQQAPATLAWTWKYYPEEVHATVPPRAEYDALHYFFRHRDLPLPSNPASPLVSAEALKRQYQALSDDFGYIVAPPEELVNLYAYGCLQNKLLDKALSLFNLNQATYPQSFNANGCLGEFYEQQGDKKQALRYYTKALSVREDPEIKQKVSGLQGHK